MMTAIATFDDGSALPARDETISAAVLSNQTVEPGTNANCQDLNIVFNGQLERELGLTIPITPSASQET